AAIVVRCSCNFACIIEIMKILAILIFIWLVILACGVNADDTCTIYGQTLQKGESYYPPGKCMQIKCDDVKDPTFLVCPSLLVSPNCILIPEDNTKAYPDCCEKAKCP
uniref:Single domain-containing protein n=1 Tax=Stomoxys calcitrans TaxID=35570 RepID=A0A1I8QES4_STOCA